MTFADTIPNARIDIADGLGPVADAFADNFQRGEERGAAFAVYQNGTLIAHCLGGHADKKGEVPFDEDALLCFYSTGKAICAMLVAMAVSDGRLDYDAPVAAVWPEFGASGKAGITLAQALSHQGGLCGLPDDFDPALYADWDAACSAIAAAEPLWKPGTASGYHPQTFGFIAGEVYRRVTGERIGAALRRLTTPEAPVYCGMTEEEMAKAAFMSKPPRAPDLGALNEFKERAFLAKSAAPGRIAREAWMAAEIPASNMHGTALGAASLLRPLAEGGHTAIKGAAIKRAAIKREVLDALFAERIYGDDLVLPFTISWAAGLVRNTSGVFGPSRTALGHAGFGGSCAVVDPAHGLTMVYAPSKMSPYLMGDPRSVRLINALYGALGY